MKFYDLEWLAQKCGTDNKYEITAKIAAEARRESEEASIEKGNPGNERYISNVLHEIEEGISPVNAHIFEPEPEPSAAEPDTTTNAAVEE